MYSRVGIVIGAGWMHLPMRERLDAAAVRERDRPPADLPACGVPLDGASDCADPSADGPSDRDVGLRASPGL